MCLGVPGRVVEIEPADDGLGYAQVEFAGIRRRVCIACVPEVQLDEYVIVHAGIAISRLDPVEAERVFAYLEEMQESDGWSGEGAPDEVRG